MATKPQLPINPIKEEATQRAFKQVQSWLQQLFETISNQASTTYGVFTALVNGLVPAPTTALGKFLRDDATWQTITPGEANTSSNTGAGAGLAKTKSGVDLPFKSLVAGANVTITGNTNDVTIASAAPGETNTASNAGGGGEVFKTKSGVDLVFRSLIGTSNITVTQNTNDLTISGPDLSLLASGFFGDGRDGSLVFDGTSTVLGITPSTQTNYGPTAPGGVSVKQYLLTRDIYCTDMTVDSGVLIFVEGFRVYVNGTLTLDGHIGGPGAYGGTGGASSGGNAGGATRTAGTIGNRLAGGSGGAPGGAAVTGTSSGVAPLGSSNTGGGGGSGNGGAGTAGGAMKGGGGGSGGNVSSGASGGTITAGAASGGSLNNVWQAITGRQLGLTVFTCGSGGGGGLGCTTGVAGSGGGGGGGSGGACAVVCAYEITGSGTIWCEGGRGGDAYSGAGAVQCGGGGGGGGGYGVCVIAKGSFPTINVTGGLGGAKFGTNGGVGGAGGDGLQFKYRLAY